MKNNYLEQAEIYATGVITNEFSNKLIRHNIGLQHRLIEGVKEIGKAESLTDIELEYVLMAGWLSQLGYKDFEKLKEDNKSDFFTSCFECTLTIAKTFLNDIGYPESDMAIVMKILEDSKPYSTVDTKLSNVLADAITIDWGKPKSKKRVRKQYEELLLTNATNLGTKSGLARSVEYLKEHKYFTNYGKRILSPKKQELILKLEKERKDFSKSENLVIQQELGISDDELKQLKKNLKSVKGRDERGVQTMFRTTSRNHYSLIQMVDRKANIMISVNAIILSLILSRVIGIIDTFCIHNSPLLVMLVSSIISIIFAVIAIIPATTHGSFSEQDVRNKEGNLLYFGNYHNMKFRDYEWGILQMLNDSNYLYSSMIKDQYFLGLKLKKKHWHIRISLAIFLIGFVAAVVAFMIVGSMSDFHLGGVHN